MCVPNMISNAYFMSKCLNPLFPSMFFLHTQDALGDPARALIELNKMMKYDKDTYEPIVSLTGLGQVPGLIHLGRGGSRGSITAMGPGASVPRADEKILKESPRNKAKRLGLPYKDPAGEGEEEGEDDEEGEEEEGNDNDPSGYNTPKKGPWKIAQTSPTNNKKVKFSAAKYSALQVGSAYCTVLLSLLCSCATHA